MAVSARLQRMGRELINKQEHFKRRNQHQKGHKKTESSVSAHTKLEYKIGIFTISVMQQWNTVDSRGNILTAELQESYLCQSE